MLENHFCKGMNKLLYNKKQKRPAEASLFYLKLYVLSQPFQDLHQLLLH